MASGAGKNGFLVGVASGKALIVAAEPVHLH
jgi:hypothetical protein